MGRRQKCIFEQCQREAFYAFNLNQDPIYCYNHKEDDTIVVSTLRCQYPKCKEKLFINGKFDKEIYCQKHIVIPLQLRNSRSNNRCIYAGGCRRIAKFANSNHQKALWCDDHKHEDDFFVINRICKKNLCCKEALYAFPGSTSMYCEEHRKNNMVIVKDNICLFTKTKIKTIDNAIKSLIIETNENNFNTSIALKELFYT